jgi:hypothetical protein
MNCSNHPLAESQGICSACRKSLCSVCIYTVKSKPFCQECIVQGAEWAPLIKGRRLSRNTPKWAALWAIIPGIGAVYNSEYLKAIAYFSIFAWLIVMADAVHGIFGFASAVFLIFTLFDAYRTAEEKAQKRLESGINSENIEAEQKDSIVWGVLLIAMGILFLLVKIVPHQYINIVWPLIFILLGAFLIYRATQGRETPNQAPAVDPQSRKEDI